MHVTIAVPNYTIAVPNYTIAVLNYTIAVLNYTIAVLNYTIAVLNYTIAVLPCSTLHSLYYCCTALFYPALPVLSLCCPVLPCTPCTIAVLSCSTLHSMYYRCAAITHTSVCLHWITHSSRHWRVHCSTLQCNCATVTRIHSQYGIPMLELQNSTSKMKLYCIDRSRWGMCIVQLCFRSEDNFEETRKFAFTKIIFWML